MDFNSGRYAHLCQLVVGYYKTGVPLISFDGKELLPDFLADDIGIYVLIPKIATFLQCSTANAINIFFYGSTFFGIFLSISAFFLLYQSWIARAVAVLNISFLMTFALMKVGDVYLFYAISAVASVPWVLYFLRYQHLSIFFPVFSFFMGIFLGFSHYIRSYSGFSTILFFLILIFADSMNIKRKIIILLCLLFGLFVSKYYFFVQNQKFVSYTQEHALDSKVFHGHPIWHSIFCGFGFLKLLNRDDIEWDDASAEKRVLSINPAVSLGQTEHYERILKKEILKIPFQQPLFFLMTLWAKIGVLLFYFLVFCHIGLVALFLYQNSWQINGAFFLALIFNAVFPLLTVPMYAYSLGFMAFASLLSTVSINNACNDYGLLNFKKGKKMLIMGCRYNILKMLVAALDKIHIALVGFDGTKFVPALNFDDVGIYVVIPKIVHYFNITLDQAIDLFFYIQLGGALFLGLLGFILLHRSILSWCFTVCSFMFLLRLMYFTLVDVYLAYFVSLMSIVPLFLYFFIKNRDSIFFKYFLLFGGIVIAFSHYVRSYSSLPVLGFLLCTIIMNHHLVNTKKIVLLTYLFLGIMVPTAYFKITIKNYENYARTHFTEFDSLQTKHPFWHPFYLGFGLLKVINDDNISWDDAFGEKKAQETNPSISIINTSEYENILKQEVLKLFKNQRCFVIWTIFAKIGILLWYLLLFSNVGLIAFFLIRRRLDLDIAFLISFGLSAITPILTIPYYHYALSFITFAFISGLFCSLEFLGNINLNMLFKMNYLKHIKYIINRQITWQN